MRLGVRQKLVLLSLLILVVVSFTFTAVQLDLTRTWREEDLRDRAVIFAREIAATIGDRHELESGALIDRKIHQIMAVRPSVLQLDIVRLPPGGGAVVATSEPAHRLPFTPADEVAVRGGAVLSRLLTDAGGRSWEVMAPIRLDGAVAGAVAARFSLKPLRRARGAQPHGRLLAHGDLRARDGFAHDPRRPRRGQPAHRAVRARHARRRGGARGRHVERRVRRAGAPLQRHDRARSRAALRDAA